MRLANRVMAGSALAVMIGICPVCTAESDPVDGVTVRDSAGVLIVASRAPAWAKGEDWRVAEAPRVTIGIEHGPEELQFDRVAGATLLETGELAVLDAGSAQIRLFDPAGRYVRSAGGAGEGPGRFRRPDHLQRRAGDTLVVWDGGLGPVSFFSEDLEYLGRVSLSPAAVMDAIGFENAAEALTPLPDLSYVLHATVRDVGSRPTPGEVFRPPRGFFRRRVSGEVDTLGWYGGLPQMFVEVGGRLQASLVLFPTTAEFAAGGAPLRMYIGLGEPFEIRSFNEQGRLERIIRRETDAVPIPRGMIREARDRRLAMAERSGRKADMERLLAALPAETHYPAHRQLIVDALGYLWVDVPGEEWSVFDPDGRWLGRVALPPVRPLEIGESYVLGLRRDEMGTESIDLYELRRTGRSDAAR